MNEKLFNSIQIAAMERFPGYSGKSTVIRSKMKHLIYSPRPGTTLFFTPQDIPELPGVALAYDETFDVLAVGFDHNLT